MKESVITRPSSIMPDGFVHTDSIKQDMRKYVGEQVRMARQAKGLTTRQLSAICGLSHSHITRIESGRYAVTIDTLAIIGNALAMEVKFVDR